MDDAWDGGTAVEVEVDAHELVESGMDLDRGCYTVCACGWRSGWTANVRDAHDELERHATTTGG